MGNSALLERTVSQIQDRLNLITQSHKLVSHNIANTTTPGYQAKDVSFKNLLKESFEETTLHLTRSNAHHLAQGHSPSSAVPVEVEETGPVSLEQEMMKLARNSVEYQYMITLLNKKFASLKLAISEGAS